MWAWKTSIMNTRKIVILVITNEVKLYIFILYCNTVKGFYANKVERTWKTCIIIQQNTVYIFPIHRIKKNLMQEKFATLKFFYFCGKKEVYFGLWAG